MSTTVQVKLPWRRRSVRQGRAGRAGRLSALVLGSGRGREVRVWGVSGLVALTLGGWMTTLAGYLPSNVDVFASRAWLVSSAVGQIALVDGSVSQVAARLSIGRAGHDLGALQLGPDALVVDRTDGAVIRVAAADLSVSAAQFPLGPGVKHLSLLVGQGLDQAETGTRTVYAVDSDKGTTVGLDPVTLAPTTHLLALSSLHQPATTSGQSPTALVDAEGRLWTVDTSTGDVVWLDSAKERRVRAVGDSRELQLTEVRGHPAVVDLGRRVVHELDPDSGAVISDTDLDVRDGDQLQVGGAAALPLVYAVVANRGLVLVSQLGGQTVPVPLTATIRKLGRAVEVEGRLFIPDLATGQVTVVDLVKAEVVAQVKLDVTPGVRLQLELTARNDRVFYNDLGSEKAGVIVLGGGSNASPKYDPRKPAAGITKVATLSPTTALRLTPTGGGSGSAQGSGAGSPSTTTPPMRTPSTTTPPTSSPPALPHYQLAVAGVSVVGSPLTFAVLRDGVEMAVPLEWSFGDSVSQTRARASHTYAVTGTYQVAARLSGTVVVSGTLTIGAGYLACTAGSGTTTLTFTSSPPPTCNGPVDEVTPVLVGPGSATGLLPFGDPASASVYVSFAPAVTANVLGLAIDCHLVGPASQPVSTSGLTATATMDTTVECSAAGAPPITIRVVVSSASPATSVAPIDQPGVTVTLRSGTSYTFNPPANLFAHDSETLSPCTPQVFGSGPFTYTCSATGAWSREEAIATVTGQVVWTSSTSRSSSSTCRRPKCCSDDVAGDASDVLQLMTVWDRTGGDVVGWVVRFVGSRVDGLPQFPMSFTCPS